MKKIGAILLAMLLLCGCNNNAGTSGQEDSNVDLNPVKGGELRLFCDYPDTLNPIVTGFKSVAQVMNLVYDGLFRTENDFSATPVLSSGYTSFDGNKRYVVRLKKDVKFHDGTDFGAEDVVATLDKIRETGSVYNVNLSNVVSYSAQSDGSVEFNLATPQANFINLLDFPILPSESTSRDYLPENRGFYPEGTGKFKVKSADSQKLVLSRNDKYFGGKSYVDDVVITYIRDRNIAKYSFEAMEFDMITTDLYAWGGTSMAGDFNTFEYESNRLVYLGFDCTNPLLADSSIRKAISVAVDKSEFVDEVLYTHGAIADSPVNPNAYFADNAYVRKAYEQGKAMEELKKQGWLDLDGDGVLDKYFNDQQESLYFNLIVNAQNPSMADIATRLSAQLALDGISVNVVSLTYEEYAAAVLAGQFDMFLGKTDIANDCDLTFMLHSTSTRNYFKYASGDMDNALKAISQADGNHTVRSAYKTFDDLFKGEMPFVPLYFETDALFASVRVKGELDISRTGVYTGLHNAFVKYKD